MEAAIGTVSLQPAPNSARTCPRARLPFPAAFHWDFTRALPPPFAAIRAAKRNHSTCRGVTCDRIGVVNWVTSMSALGPSAGYLLQPEVLLPEQYFSGRATVELSPERRLMLAVLEDAIATWVRYRGDERARTRRLLREVERWMADSDTSWPFSFQNICDALNLDPAYLRRGLRAIGRTPEPARSSTPKSVVAFARRVAGRRHKVGLILPHRKVAS
jgi:hypothetical protein